MKRQAEGRDENADGELAPLDVTAARTMTAGIREALGDVHLSVAVLAQRVRTAHEARVWTVLGHASWAAYAEAEFGVSRAQAYRLIEVSRAAEAIAAALEAVGGVSHARDTPTARDALDFGLSQRALPAVAGREDEVVALNTRRLAVLTGHGAPPDENALGAVVHQAVRDVRDVRSAPAPAPAAPVGGADPAVAVLRLVADDLAATAMELGELILEIAPAYLSDARAAERLAPLCEQIGEDLENGLAARRHAITGDRRTLCGTLL
ncbi:hypothetical protein ABT084_11275 [Streptomyces sp. NPDC002138]|uniref:hypothetical protein n=1 Tax=Streptomyces sp. NPDC002138 TaxID=3154410 RepID=UPI00332523E8